MSTDERGENNRTEERFAALTEFCYIFGPIVIGSVTNAKTATAAPPVRWEHGKNANACNHTTGEEKINLKTNFRLRGGGEAAINIRITMRIAKRGGFGLWISIRNGAVCTC